jgi:phosphatidylglycerophosphatase A
MTESRWPLALITVFGLGRWRPAPGTWASLLPVVIVLLLQWMLTQRVNAATLHGAMNATLIALALGGTLICLKFGHVAEAQSRMKDPPNAVADEVAGQSIALLALPWRFSVEHDAHTWKWNLSIAIVAFVAFRAMDILKPPPARQLQRLPGGLGIVADDLIAGVYAFVLSQIAGRYLLP